MQHTQTLSISLLPPCPSGTLTIAVGTPYLPFASFICYFLSAHLPSPLSLSLFALRFDDPDANADALVCACVCAVCVAAASNAFLLIQLAEQRELPRNWQRL